MFRLVFYLFLLLFFACAQDDVVNYLWSILAQRPVSPYPWLSAVGLTALLAGFGSALSACGKRMGIHGYWAYVVVGWCAAALVSLPFASGIWQAALGAVAVLLGTLLTLWDKRLLRLWGEERTLWQAFMPPVVVLLVLCLYVGIGAAATDLDHYELRTAQALRVGDSGRASQVGEKSSAVSHRLFALRCYSLAASSGQGLGQHLFERPVPKGGSGLLFFPADAKQGLLFPADSLARLLGSKRLAHEADTDYLRRCAYAEQARGGKSKHRPAADYYLCALLLDRKLDNFAQEVSKFYHAELIRRQLPAYFAQALAYYTRTRTHPVVVYRDAAVEANWHDYAEMRDSIPHPAARRNLLRRTYGDTFWWWYAYAG